MGRAFGYARVPAAEAERETLDGQERALHERAASDGLDLVKIFREEDEVSTGQVGAALAEAIAALAPGTTFMIPCLDVLSEDLLRQELLLRDIRDRGAALLTCAEDEGEYLGDDAASLARDLILP
jgi:DNA invertase Pin-like site-specific DNA recombinase